MIYYKVIITLGNSSDWRILFDLLWNDELKMHGSRVYSKNDHVFDSLFASNAKKASYKTRNGNRNGNEKKRLCIPAVILAHSARAA